MKLRHLLLSIIFLVAFGEGLNANPVDEVIKTESDKITLLAAIERISQEYEVYFTFDMTLVSDVEVEYEDRSYSSAQEAVSHILKGTNLRYKFYDRRFVILYKEDEEGLESLRQMSRHLDGLISEGEQTIASSPRKEIPSIPRLASRINTKIIKKIALSIQGKVVDQDGEPLIGVNIQIKGTDRGTATDFDGTFSLDDVDENAILIVSYVGYQTQEIPISGRASINVIMISDLELLDEVVIVGYSAIRRSHLTSSVVTLNSERITDNVTHDLGSMLQGKVSGLMITNSSGEPGSSAQMRIRGVGSITAGQSPLIVVDGIPGGSYDPNDIESVSVLKDVGSTAIYGADGANGVIVITTKQGRKNEAPTVTFSSNLATTNALFGRFRPMDGTELYNLWASWQIPNFESNYPHSLRNENHNWLNTIFKTASLQEYHGSVKGGTENISYMVSLNHFNHLGTMPGTSFKRNNIRMNFNLQLTPNLDASVRMTMRENNNNNLWSFIFREMAYRGIPWDDPFDNDGKPINIAEIPSSEASWYYANRQNPWHGYQYNYSKSGATGMNLDLVVNWHIFPWLNINNTLRLGRSQNWFKVFYDSRDASQTYNGIINGSRVEDGSTYPLGGYGNTTLIRLNKDIEKHNFNSVLGYEFGESQGSYSFSANAQEQPIGIEVISAGAAETMRTSGGYSTPSAGWSAFTQINYSYDDKYLASLSYRMDANSRFAPGNRIGYFPAISAGWILSNENFFKDNSTLAYMKIRGSYGLTGNSSIGNFAYLDAFSFSGVTYLGTPGAQPTRLSNPSLGWESALMASMGLEVRVKNWLDAVIDIYSNLNKDLLFASPVAPSTGFYSYTQNIGEVSNKGIEIELNTVNFSNDNSRWTSSFNIGFNKNTVEKLPGEDPSEPGTPIMVGSADAARQRMEEGKELYGWYMQEWRGVDPENGDPLWTSEEGGVTNNYSEAKIDWLNSSPNPKFVGGLQNNISYKNISMGLNIFFLYGNTIYNGARSSMDNDGRQAQYNQMSINNGLGWSRWEKPGDNATHPRPVYGGNKQSASASSRFLEDGSFLRIRNANIGYNFPDRILSKLYISKLRIYLSGDNLFTYSRFSGSDPETNLTSSGINSVAGSVNWIYPVNRTFSFGAEIEF